MCASKIFLLVLICVDDTEKNVFKPTLKIDKYFVGWRLYILTSDWVAIKPHLTLVGFRNKKIVVNVENFLSRVVYMGHFLSSSRVIAYQHHIAHHVRKFV